MCSYKCWVWLTAIYSIPLILVLILGDVISLVGLNAPHLFQYNAVNPTPASVLGYLAAHQDQPRLGEPAALRIAYENQFIRNLDADNSVEANTETSDEVQEITTAVTNPIRSEPTTSSDVTESPSKENSLESTGPSSEQPSEASSKLSSEPTKENTETTGSSSEPTKESSDITEPSSEPSEEPRLASTNKPIFTDKPTPTDKPASTKASSTAKQADEGATQSMTKSTTSQSTTVSAKDQMTSAGPVKRAELKTTTTEMVPGKGEPDDPNQDKEPTDKPDDKPDDGSSTKPDEDLPEDPQLSREPSRNEILKRSWNEFMNGIYANDQRVLLNVFVIIKICFRILTLVTLPLLIIGNQKSRSTYIKPFKILLLLQFLFAIGITIYYAIAATECEYYKNIGDWLPRHFEEPTGETGKNVARLYLLITFADLFPYFCIVSLILINKRDRQINRKKEESHESNWDIQLNPISLPRIKNTANSDHISPLNLHFNQTANDNLPMTAGLITNEEISVNNQPFSYTSNTNHQSTSSQGLPCYDNHAFSKN